MKPCLIWTKAKSKQGYGQLWDGKGKEYVHRISWILWNGLIPTGLCVLHKCDNPSCYEPTHLFLGTKQDNMIDKARKGRAIALHQKLNPYQKIELQKELAQGIKQRTLARKYGITPEAIFWHKKHGAKIWA